MNKIISLIVIGMLSIPISNAATTTIAPKATATLTSSCSVNTAPINFGDITATSTATEWVLASGNVGVLCSNKVSYSITLNLGVNNAGQSGRWMIGTKGQKIPYAICATNTLNAGQTNCVSPWFQYGGTNYVVSDIGNGSNQDHPSYGFLTRGFYTPDTYSDTTTATISF